VARLTGEVARAVSSCTVPFAVVSVYRRRNAAVLQTLLGQLVGSPSVALWALDEPHDELADLTVGQGPGTKWELINRLIGSLSLDDGTWLVVADDDVCFAGRRGHLLLRYAVEAELDICQPAHSLLSIFSRAFTLANPFAKVTETGYVEIGPLFVVSPKVRSRVWPFPEDTGMGWGTELLWHGLRKDGYRLGKVDATPIIHCGVVAADYDMWEAKAHFDRIAASTGVRLQDTLVRYRRWWAWQRAAPWATPDHA
jgi:hypothetical protein